MTMYLKLNLLDDNNKITKNHFLNLALCWIL